MTKNLMIHVDIDSPIKLLNFYKVKNVVFDQNQLELFYEKAWERMLGFFDKQNIKATFFIVGDELVGSEIIKNIIIKAYQHGHEIENHTFSHPFGLAYLSEEKIKEEIVKCNQVIEDTIGVKPIGFRSPGYSMNTKIIKTLEELDFQYDTSGFWSIMNPLLKISQKVLFKNGISNGDFGGVSRKLKQNIYYPHSNNWIESSFEKKGILELPLPRTNSFGLPFYNNFNLWAPSFYSNYMSKSINKENLIYLFHIIEFIDMSDDGIPSELSIHPNIKKSVSTKMIQSEKLLSNLLERYSCLKTRDLVDDINKVNR